MLESSKPHRASLSELVDSIVALNDQAREDGLLSLEDKIPELSSDFLKIAIQLLVDGCETEEIEQVLRTVRHADGRTGSEQVERMMIEAGVLAIHRGTNSRMLKTILAAYLGEEAALKATLE